MYGHHAATDGELSVVPPCGRDHVAQLEDVAHPGVLLGEVVHTHLAWHVVPVVSTEARLHFLQRETWIVESFFLQCERNKLKLNLSTDLILLSKIRKSDAVLYEGGVTL